MIGKTEYLRLDIDREADNRWIAEIPAYPGVLAYGLSESGARAKALRLMADVLEGLAPASEPSAMTDDAPPSRDAIAFEVLLRMLPAGGGSISEMGAAGLVVGAYRVADAVLERRAER